MTRPLLLLDVDGVLNPYGTPLPPAGYTDHDLFPGEEPVRVNPAHGVWITKARRVFDVAWAGHGSPTLLIPVDPAVGLTRDQVDRALGWAGALPAAG